MSAPKIAIVIPTYNRAETIGEAVASVLADPAEDFELIVVDDASTDGTAAVLAAFGDPRLRHARLGTRGNGNAARNHGARLSTAPILAFLDSDDVFLPGRISRLLRFFEANPDVDAVLDGFSVVNRDRHFAPPDLVEMRLTGGAFIDLMVTHAVPLTCSAIAVRRAAFEAVSGFDPELARQQDRDLLIRLARAHNLAIHTGTDVVKHQSADSLSRLAAGYAAGLDALVARHPVFLEPERRDVLAYLVARAFLGEFSSGRVLSGLGVMRGFLKARHIPVGLLTALLGYKRGRQMRRQAEAALVRASRVVAA